MSCEAMVLLTASLVFGVAAGHALGKAYGAKGIFFYAKRAMDKTVHFIQCFRR